MMSRGVSQLQRRPTTLYSSSRGGPDDSALVHGKPCHDEVALVRGSVLRSPLRSPFGVARPPDGFAVGGNPTLESLYFAGVAPPSPEPWDSRWDSPITVMSKPRAFPRTNPAYVHRDGLRPSYRKIDAEELRGHERHGGVKESISRGRQFIDDAAVCFDKRRAQRHEHSDSDTSHSSFGISRLQQQPDLAQAGQQRNISDRGADIFQGGQQRNISDWADQKLVVSRSCRDAFSDSQGSLSQLVSADSLSSRGSSRVYVNSAAGGAAGTMLSSPHDSLSSRDSPRCVPDPRRYELVLNLAAVDRQSQSVHSTPTSRVRVRRNSEPDYANLPVITAAAGFHNTSETGSVLDPALSHTDNSMPGHNSSMQGYNNSMPGCVGGPVLSHKDNSSMPGHNNSMVGHVIADEQRSGESLQSGDSLSPVEFSKQHDGGTPNSVRSASTRASTASNTSEGSYTQSVNIVRCK